MVSITRVARLDRHAPTSASGPYADVILYEDRANGVALPTTVSPERAGGRRCRIFAAGTRSSRIVGDNLFAPEAGNFA
jgi:hypothetical protein